MSANMEQAVSGIDPASVESEVHTPSTSENAGRHHVAIPVNGNTMSETLALFRMVFEAAQKPDEENVRLQRKLSWILIIALCVQVVWAIAFITYVVLQRSVVASSMITFISLLVTAILAEVVAMAFLVVKFVFRTPLDSMLDLLKDIINKSSS